MKCVTCGNHTTGFCPLAGIKVLNDIEQLCEWLSKDESFRPLAGIKVLNFGCQTLVRKIQIVSVPLRGLRFLTERIALEKAREEEQVSVPLRGLRFLTAPLTNGFITPSKMAFAGRILFFYFFRDFLWKCLSQILQTRMFITSGQNVIKSIDLFILYHIFNLKEIPHPPSYRHNKSPRKAMAAYLRDFRPPYGTNSF